MSIHCVNCHICGITYTPQIRNFRYINVNDNIENISLCNKHGLFVSRHVTPYIEKIDVVTSLLLLKLINET